MISALRIARSPAGVRRAPGSALVGLTALVPDLVSTRSSMQALRGSVA